MVLKDEENKPEKRTAKHTEYTRPVMNEQTNATPAAATAQGSGPSQPTNTASSLGGGSGSASAPTGASAVASAQSGTVTMTETETQTAAPPEVLSLTLSARPSVRWYVTNKKIIC